MENRPSFAEIESLLVDRRVDKEHDTLVCLFECPVTRRRVEASATIRQGNSFTDRLLDSASRSFWHELRQVVARTVCSFLPHGFVREVVQGTAWQMSYHRGRSDEISSKSELDQATVDAFLRVRHEFELHQGEWRAREVAVEFVTDFEKQLQQAPISTRYEGEILARTLNHLAAFDGMDPFELTFLEDFGVSPSGQHPPSAVELSELRDEVKPTLYLLAAALALVDQDQSGAERQRLAQLESALGVSAQRASELRRAAGQFIVDQCLGLDIDPTPEQQRSLAKLAGLSVEEVERVLVRRRKRSLRQ